MTDYTDGRIADLREDIHRSMKEEFEKLQAELDSLRNRVRALEGGYVACD